MPGGLDGAETVVEIRKKEEEWWPHLGQRCHEGKWLYIVALTASATQEAKEVCARAGMQEFVAKPVKKALLEAVLLKCRQWHQASVDTRC